MAASSQTLSQAVHGLVEKQNQIVRTGVVTELRADGSVYCKVQGKVLLVRACTDEPMEAGKTVSLVKSTGGKFTLLGSS
jgi:hypothetical protein